MAIIVKSLDKTCSCLSRQFLAQKNCLFEQLANAYIELLIELLGEVTVLYFKRCALPDKTEPIFAILPDSFIPANQGIAVGNALVYQHSVKRIFMLGFFRKLYAF